MGSDSTTWQWDPIPWMDDGLKLKEKNHDKKNPPHQRKSCQHMITLKQVEKKVCFFDSFFWGGYCTGGGGRNHVE